MNYTRERWILKRNCDGAIMCGQARNYDWKLLEEIGNAAICSYMSEKKALAAARSSWHYDETKVQAIRVKESYISF